MSAFHDNFERNRFKQLKSCEKIRFYKCVKFNFFNETKQNDQRNVFKNLCLNKVIFFSLMFKRLETHTRKKIVKLLFMRVI